MALKTITSAMFTTLVAAMIVGGLLHQTGRMESIARIHGFSGVVVGWILFLGYSLVAGLMFAAVSGFFWQTSFVPAEKLKEEIGAIEISVVVGIGYGLAIWIVGVAIAMPILMDAVSGIERPLPYLHGLSLLGLLIFGAILGGLFPLVQGIFEGDGI